jgi:hypothetical protein
LNPIFMLIQVFSLRPRILQGDSWVSQTCCVKLVLFVWQIRKNVQKCDQVDPGYYTKSFKRCFY